MSLFLTLGSTVHDWGWGWPKNGLFWTNIPVRTESTCLLFLDIYTETSYLLFLQGDFFDSFCPKSSKGSCTYYVITDRGGSLGTPKSDYIICAQPLSVGDGKIPTKKRKFELKTL